MPRAARVSAVKFIKLKPAEARVLERLSRARRRAGLPCWSASAILREAFLAALEDRQPCWKVVVP
jgi:hypothetical protein